MTTVMIVVGCALALMIALSLALFLAGVGTSALWLFTFMFHATKADAVPGANDDHWSRDQGREAK